jgi:hypothetical protein
MTQHDDSRGIRPIVVFRNDAAEHRADAEHGKELGRHQLHLQFRWLAHSGQYRVSRRPTTRRRGDGLAVVVVVRDDRAASADPS